MPNLAELLKRKYDTEAPTGQTLGAKIGYPGATGQASPSPTPSASDSSDADSNSDGRAKETLGNKIGFPGFKLRGFK